MVAVVRGLNSSFTQGFNTGIESAFRVITLRRQNRHDKALRAYLTTLDPDRLRNDPGYIMDVFAGIVSGDGFSAQARLSALGLLNRYKAANPGVARTEQLDNPFATGGDVAPKLLPRPDIAPNRFPDQTSPIVIDTGADIVDTSRGIIPDFTPDFTPNQPITQPAVPPQPSQPPTNLSTPPDTAIVPDAGAPVGTQSVGGQGATPDVTVVPVTSGPAPSADIPQVGATPPVTQGQARPRYQTFGIAPTPQAITQSSLRADEFFTMPATAQRGSTETGPFGVETPPAIAPVPTPGAPAKGSEFDVQEAESRNLKPIETNAQGLVVIRDPQTGVDSGIALPPDKYRPFIYSLPPVVLRAVNRVSRNMAVDTSKATSGPAYEAEYHSHFNAFAHGFFKTIYQNGLDPFTVTEAQILALRNT